MEAFTKVETFEYDERDRLVTKTTTYTPAPKTLKEYLGGSVQRKDIQKKEYPSKLTKTSHTHPSQYRFPAHPPKDVPFTRWEPLTP